MVELISLLVTGLIFAIPGVLFSIGFFSGTKFKLLDKLFAGILIGAVVVPFLAFIEQLILGFSFSVGLVLANSLLFFLIGLYLTYSRGFFGLSRVQNVLKQGEEQLRSQPLYFLAPVLLIIIFAFAFYFRTAFSFITNFFEFDPYYYASLTETLVRHGSIPLTNDLAYFPFQKFHHEPALVTFMTASWNVVYNLLTGLAYDKGTLILITNLYPPLVGALLSVVAYWLLKAQYNETAGIVGAIFFASTPILIQKFASGVAELQPWGLFSAVLIFSTYLLALKYKQWQFTVLAGFATVLAMIGAELFIWPIGIMSAFFTIQAIVNFYANHHDENFLIVAVAFALTTVIGNILHNAYGASGVLSFGTTTLLAILSMMPAIVFYLIERFKLPEKYPRKTILAAILLLGFLGSLLPVLPSGTNAASIASQFISGASSFAGTGSPLGKTIAEETATGSGDLPGAFGVLSPIILIVLAIFLAWSAIENLLIRKKYREAAVLVLGALAIVLFRQDIANFLSILGTSINFSLFSAIGKLLAANELFAYLIISIVSAIITFITSEPENRSEVTLLTALILYPIAYIGLNKVKFLVHLSLALALGGGVLIGEISTRGRFLHKFFKVEEKMAFNWTLYFAIVIGFLLVSVQVFGFQNRAPGAINSAQSLQGSQISGDWLSAMNWLRDNTNYNNPIYQAKCNQKFGYDCRVISWWDYGHWTIFLGETKSVLDPGNSYPNFDQEVAYGFVDNQSAFLKSMAYHNASHVLVDYQLLDKWGALMFLSGSCQKYADNSTTVSGITCPNARQIVNWQNGAGRDPYELDYSFERMEIKGQCPFSQGLLLAQSSFGAVYCASDSQIIPVDKNGLRTDLARTYKVIDLRNPVAEVNETTHYLIPVSQTEFIDVNPDLRVIGRVSKAINSTYIRLYVFENLPGFKLAFRSPNGEVKIFEKE